MSTNVQHIRTAIITSKVIGPIVSWGWKHYISAIATSAPDDCADIPKVPQAGKCFSDLQGEYQLMHNGLKIRMGSYYNDLNKYIIEQLAGHHEPQEELVFYKVLRTLPETAVMIEAGSYWGYYSLWFKKDKPKGSAYLIEPLEKRLQAGKRNFKLNDLEGTFFRAYVGATSEPAHSVEMEGETVRDIERITIDDFMKRFAIDYVDVLHVDVQGAEFDLLSGAERAISAGKVGYIFISTHGKRVHNDCVKFLAKYNFRIIASHTRAESFTTDGLIVVGNKNLVGLGEVVISKKKSGFLGDLGLVTVHLLKQLGTALGLYETRKSHLQLHDRA